MQSSRQKPLPGLSKFIDRPFLSALENASNLLEDRDREIHEWYRFVLSFPPHLVRHYLNEFQLNENTLVLDPFCGTGTTLVEAKLSGFRTLGVEAYPFSHFVSKVKVRWDINPQELLDDANEIRTSLENCFEKDGLNDLYPYTGDLDALTLPVLDKEQARLLIKNSISPVPLRKTLQLISAIDQYDKRPHYQHLRLALAKSLVTSIGNLRFGPEVGVGRIKNDTPVVATWLSEVRTIAEDIKKLPDHQYPQSIVRLADARDLQNVLTQHSVNAVITSPPYPNEKDYTRTTRLESVLLGFIKNRKELRRFKKQLVRSNTRGVYKADTDDQWIEDFPEVLEISEAIEEKRKELGKTSGFERAYHRVTRLYFGGMTRHLSNLKPYLAPGAKLAYVVGDQASYLRVMIRTGTLLARIADRLGYKVENIDLFRKRFATATGEELREEVVVLRWSGS
jgi:hypothetical protein